jgi:glycosyltransferase involved in cell wall biosynthesis
MKNNHRKNNIDPASKIRILHLLPDKDRKFSLFENLVTGLDKQAFSQSICYLHGNMDEPNPLKKLGYEIFCIGIPKKKLRRFRPSMVFQIARIIKEQDIDIVHCQRHKPTVYGTLAAWMVSGNIKVVTTVHGRNRTRTIGRKLLNRILFKRILRIFAVSKAVRNDIIKTNWALSADKVVTVYNGIDTKQFSNFSHTRQEARERLHLPNKETFIFGTVGRLTKVKGQVLLLKAFASVCRKYPNSLLVLAGVGPLEAELRSLAAKLNIQKHVVFLGYRKDIPDVLQAYDVFVLPSLSEGLPLALMEAMVTGIPVIASRVGGIPEILNSPHLGAMVSPSSMEELTSAMERVREMDATKRNEIGQILKNRVLGEFTKEKMVAAMAKEYTAVMNNHASR